MQSLCRRLGCTSRKPKKRASVEQSGILRMTSISTNLGMVHALQDCFRSTIAGHARLLGDGRGGRRRGSGAGRGLRQQAEQVAMVILRLALARV